MAFDITTSVMPGHECVTVYARTNLTSKTEKIVQKNTKQLRKLRILQRQLKVIQICREEIWL